MGKRSNRRSAAQDDTNVGCVWGLMRMVYFRRDPRFLMDAKQAGGRHKLREITDGRDLGKRPRDFEEIEKDDNIENGPLQQPTVKKLMEDELGRVNLLRTVPNNEVQRRLAHLGNDLSLDRNSEHTNNTTRTLNDSTDISVSRLSGSVDSEGSKSLNHSEYDLESVLASFLGEIYRCHNECPHDDCKSNSELCPSLKSLIHKKLNDLSNLQSNIDCEQPQESKGEKLLGGNGISSSRTVQSKEFKDALEILGSNKELFLKVLQKPNSHMLDNIRNHQNSRLTTKLEPNKNLGETNSLEETRGSNHDLSAPAQAKESKHMFFWRKDKSKIKQMLPEGINGSQPVSKIVILKPNPGKGIDQTVTSSARYLHQQPSTSQTPEYSGRETSKFSIKEVRRRFRIVTGETRRERNAAPADDLQRVSRWHSMIATKKSSGYHTQGSLADKSASNFKNDIARPSTSSKQKQQNGSETEISGRIAVPQDDSIFYKEAKKHLTNMLKDNNKSGNYPTAQVSKSLEGMLSLPHCDVSSPRNSRSGKCHTDLSPEETDSCLVPMVDSEETTQESCQSWDDSLSNTAHCPSVAVDDQVVVQDKCSMKEEPQEGQGDVTDVVDTTCIEEIGKIDCSETICNTQSISAELCRDSPQPDMIEKAEQGKEPVQILLSYPESIVELEQQEPGTPEPRASAKFISDCSPELSHDKQEQPSPVSVLDSFYEDVADPECENIKQCDLHEELRGALYFPDNESDLKVFWEEKSIRLDYIKLVLELSELCAEQNLEVWYLEDELISPCLLEELPNQGDQIDDLKILFDCICEALTEIQERYFRLSSWLSFLKHDIRAPPMGEDLVAEVDKYVDDYLRHSFPSTLDHTIKKDFEVRTWMDIRSKTEGIVVEIWEFVLDELIDEAVFDLWI
ncbi:hypothetical protein CFC21_006930 [Triticum aestivum]|uniref:DUF4378 domain-containing protein n=2 Tax=Triticum aestivum TaxID=4565 RepID=A0A3B5YYF6_WHEAT|nr:uncharacterized protein LOC123127659 [Triticum aestivum]XP_044403370.1 uncharacterized protein LOC123127659 [Triticum aestivum]KAF6989612.1 hypothetical protein CFC21_006930 [Triticum aestivum]